AVLQDAVGGEDARRRAGLVRRRDEIVDLERPVREVAVERRQRGWRSCAHRPAADLRERRHIQVHVELGYARVRGTPDVLLRRVRRVARPSDAVDPFPTAVEVVEAVVLLVDDDDVVDLRELVRPLPPCAPIAEELTTTGIATRRSKAGASKRRNTRPSRVLEAEQNAPMQAGR